MNVAGKIRSACTIYRERGAVETARALRANVRALLYPHATEINYRGRGVINLIDVGAAGGLSMPWNQHACRVRRVLCFEPRDEPSVTDNAIASNVALWEEDCERDFFIHGHEKQTGSSLFRQNYDYVRENFETLRRRGPSELAETWFARSELTGQLRLPCRTLDNVIAELAADTPFHFLKIDAQGAEYNILRGAERLLSTSCLGLCLELFTVPLYQGIHLLPEVEQRLSTFGFALRRKFPAHGAFDSQHDCLFLKSDAADDKTLKVIERLYGV